MSIAIRLWETGDAAHCRMTIPMRGGGTIAFVVTLTHKQVLEALHRAGIQFSRQQVGSIFGSIGKALKKVAKVGVLKKALSLGAALVNNPLVKLVAPQAAIAIAAASGAAKLISAAKGGDKKKAEKAKLAIRAAQAQAALETKAGKQLPLPTGVANRSPETKAAFRYLVTVNRAAA